MGECPLSHQVLKDLYHEIYQIHWSYLELEEGLQKFEELRILEGLLNKFLCVVPHNRKFFLPETFIVFKRTITQMKDFNVVKMLNGFESISQYANNLFTKPWRKEYRTIKMYSGFFIHEIKSNLVDPEELFLAMGYEKTANNELVLVGEICPDQVMNMSRDAMTAYTECKILNRIYSELTTVYNLSCSWPDVFHYREHHTGGVAEAIEGIRKINQINGSVQKQSMPTYGQRVTMMPYLALDHIHAPESYLAEYSITNRCSHSINVPQARSEMLTDPVHLSHIKHINGYDSRSYPKQTPHLSTTNDALLFMNQPVATHNDCEIRSQVNEGRQNLQQLYHALDHQQPSNLFDFPTPATFPHSKSMDNNYNYPSILPAFSSHTSRDTQHCDGKNDIAFYEPAMKHYSSAAIYNEPGTRYPMSYSLSAQLEAAHETPLNFRIGNYRTAGDVYYEGINMKSVPYSASDCISHQRTGAMTNTVPPGSTSNYPQYYSELIKPATDHSQQPAAVGLKATDLDELHHCTPHYPLKEVNHHQKTRTSDFDSYEEMFVDRNNTSKDWRQPTLEKIQDGLGSFETWDYVYHCLDSDNRRPCHGGMSKRRLLDKPRTGSSVQSKTIRKQESDRLQKQVSNLRAMKPTTGIEINQPKSNVSNGEGSLYTKVSNEHEKLASDSAVIVNPNNGLNNRQVIRKEGEQLVSNSCKKEEWSCRFCTFLNESSRKICEICSKSKDFTLDNSTACA